MSLTGIEEGIQHGTPRGYRQHRRRRVPITNCTCRDAWRQKNADDDAARRTGGRRANPAQRQWNRGKTTGAPTSQPRPLTTVGNCTTQGCGQEATDSSEDRPDWVQIHVEGSTEARSYCSGPCAAFGKALAELRVAS